MIADTSLASYDAVRADGTVTKQAGVILALLRQFPDREFSRFDIHAVTGLRLASVCGRVDELLGAWLAREVGTKIDPLTNKTVKTLKLAPRQTNAASAV